MLYLTLLKRFWKPLAGLLVVAGGAPWAYQAIHAYGDRQKDSGRREIQAKWDAAVEKRRKADEAADLENRSKNAETERQHAQALADIAADRDRLGSRLLSANAKYRAAQAAYSVLSADAASRIASSEAEFARRLEVVRSATTAYDAACQRDAVTLTGLQDEVRPWVVTE